MLWMKNLHDFKPSQIEWNIDVVDKPSKKIGTVQIRKAGYVKTHFTAYIANENKLKLIVIFKQKISKKFTVDVVMPELL